MRKSLQESVCLYCKRTFTWTKKNAPKTGKKYCNRECYLNGVRANQDKIAYPKIWHNGKLKWLHRHIYEQHHGVELRPDQIIHHKDENPFNRAIENLELIEGEEALREHLMKHKWWRKRYGRKMEVETTYEFDPDIPF